MINPQATQLGAAKPIFWKVTMPIGPLEILIIVLLVVVLFGAKKLPDAARSIGRSMRIFKSEVKEMGNDGKEDGQSEDTPAANQQGQLPQGSTAAGEFWEQPQNQPRAQHPENPQQNPSQSNN